LALEGAECQSPFHKLRNILTETAEDRVPTYQYACTECGHFFEQFQSFTDDALTECPVCSGKLRKVFNAVGVVFKGSGFYRNDSRAPSSEKSEGGPKEKSASTTEKSSSGEKSSSTTSSSAAAAS
jgi:putative FmdB family regulatory protein